MDGVGVVVVVGAGVVVGVAGGSGHIEGRRDVKSARRAVRSRGELKKWLAYPQAYLRLAKVRAERTFFPGEEDVHPWIDQDSPP